MQRSTLTSIAAHWISRNHHPPLLQPSVVAPVVVSLVSPILISSIAVSNVASFSCSASSFWGGWTIVTAAAWTPFPAGMMMKETMMFRSVTTQRIFLRWSREWCSGEGIMMVVKEWEVEKVTGLCLLHHLESQAPTCGSNAYAIISNTAC